jgi:hypothetical protein
MIIGCVIISSAQSPGPDNTSAQAVNAKEAASVALPSPSPTVPIEPPSLIPPNILPGPGAGSLPQIPGGLDLQRLNDLFKQTSLGKASDEARLHLQMVQLEARIRNDDDLHVARATADEMGTDLEKRHRLKAYYNLYYNKLRALTTAPDLKAYLDLQEAAHVGVLLQPKVRHETDEAIAKAGGGAKALPPPVQAKPPQTTLKP